MRRVVASAQRCIMKRLLHMLQTATGATKGEVTVVVLLLAGAIVGNIAGRIGPNEQTIASPEMVKRRLSSRGLHPDPAERVVTTSSQDAQGGVVDVRTTLPKASASSRQPAPVNLNSASKTRLMTLPGVGEATAERILQHRSRTPFARPEDLMHVKGIGEKRFERMRPFVTAP